MSCISTFLVALYLALTQKYIHHYSELQLKGAYRKILHLPRNIEYRLLRYTDTEMSLAQSDEEKILDIEHPVVEPFEQRQDKAEVSKDGDDEQEKQSFVALQLRFTLGTAAYATMALREVLKQDTSVQVQKDMTERGEDRAFRGSGGAPPHNRGRREEGAGLSWKARQAVNEVQVGKGRTMRSWGNGASNQEEKKNEEITSQSGGETKQMEQ